MLNKGKILAIGKPEEVLTSENIKNFMKLKRRKWKVKKTPTSTLKTSKRTLSLGGAIIILFLMNEFFLLFL
jgi:ABC-type cobalamin/Fe3+-siderophores transport system ATPase subunit